MASEDEEGRTPLWFTRASVECVSPDWETAGAMPATGHVGLAPLDMLAGNLYGYLTYTFGFRQRLDTDKVKTALGRILAHYPLLVGRVSLEPDGTYGVSWGPGQGPGAVDFTSATSPLSLSDLQLPRSTSSSSGATTGETKEAGTRPAPSAFHIPTDFSILLTGNPSGDAKQYLLEPSTSLASFMLCDLAPEPLVATASSTEAAADGSVSHQTEGSPVGGSLLVINVHHLLFDGTSIKHFVADWAATARGQPHTTLHVQPTSFGRQCWSQLAAHASQLVEQGPDGWPQHAYMGLSPEVPASHQEEPPKAVDKPHIVNLAVHVSGGRLAQLRQQALCELRSETAAAAAAAAAVTASNSSAPPTSSAHAPGASQDSTSHSHRHVGDPWVSYNDVLLARVWQVLGSLPGRPEFGSNYNLYMAVNLRKRLRLPRQHGNGPSGGGDMVVGHHENLALPSHAVGNWIAHVLATPPDAPSKTSLGSLAVVVRQAVDSARTVFGPQHVALFDHAVKQGVVGRIGYGPLMDRFARGEPNLVITHWDSAAAPLDFGSGPPTWFACANPQMPNFCAVVPDLQSEVEAHERKLAAHAAGVHGVTTDGGASGREGVHASKQHEGKVQHPPGAWLYLWLQEDVAQQLLDMKVTL